MSSSIEIREYTPNDKNHLVNLIRLNTPEFFAPAEEHDLIKYLDTERELYYVLVFERKIVGCGGINFADNHTRGIISWDIFHPDYQKKSFGTKLLQYRLEKLNEMDNIQKISVRTSQHVFKFYEKQGFELIEIKKDYWAKNFDLYYMEYKT